MRMLLPTDAAPRRRRPGARRGAAVLEFAVIGVMLTFVIVGMVEMSRGLLVRETLTNAARTACRAAALPGSSNASVTQAAQSILTDDGITAANATITIRVNGAAADVNTAKAGDKISVQLSIAASKVNWSGQLFLKDRTIESAPYVMMRQQ